MSYMLLTLPLSLCCQLKAIVLHRHSPHIRLSLGHDSFVIDTLGERTCSVGTKIGIKQHGESNINYMLITVRMTVVRQRFMAHDT